MDFDERASVVNPEAHCSNAFQLFPAIPCLTRKVQSIVMIRLLLKAIVVLVLGLPLSCRDDGAPLNCRSGEQTGKTDITKIQYGTSFGMCVGRCKTELTATFKLTELEKASWDNSIEAVRCTKETTCEEWLEMTKKIDLTEFFSMQESYGCPDCADGGAEWMLIYTGSSRHRVTFEYGNPPEELRPYIAQYRALAESFENCD